MSTVGDRDRWPRERRRSTALDRLHVVPDSPPRDTARVDGSPSVTSSSADLGASAEPADVVNGVGALDDGWGVTAMPAWLRSAPDTNRVADDDPDEFDDWHPDDPDEFDDPHDPGAPRRRLLVAPPGALALILIGVIAVIVAGIGLWRSGDSAPVIDFPTPGAAASAAGAAGAPSGEATAPTAAVPPSTPATEIVVSVVGLVVNPGLHRLPPNARVADAIERAGGARKNADLLSLNLAQPVNDGDQVLVGYLGEKGGLSMGSAVVSAGGSAAGGAEAGASSGATTQGTAGASGAGSSGGKVDLNTATEAQLDELPGVGPVTAKAIIAWRQANGRFTSVDQLAEVDGIGPARLAKLRDLVVV